MNWYDNSLQLCVSDFRLESRVLCHLSACTSSLTCTRPVLQRFGIFFRWCVVPFEILSQSLGDEFVWVVQPVLALWIWGCCYRCGFTLSCSASIDHMWPTVLKGLILKCLHPFVKLSGIFQNPCGKLAITALFQGPVTVGCSVWTGPRRTGKTGLGSDLWKMHHFPGDSVADLRLLALFAAAWKRHVFSETPERAS